MEARAWLGPRWLGTRFAGPLTLALAALAIVTTEAGYRASDEVAARRDDAVDVRDAVGRARRVLLGMEAAQRGYLLTGRPEYRVPYDEARAQEAEVLRALRALAAATPPHREALLALSDAVERKTSELAEVMRLFERGERERALTLLLTDIGREQMERVNQLVDAVAASEDDAYRAATRQREQVRLWSRVGTYALVALCLGAVLAGRRVLAERERERARHVAELRAERDRLDSQVVQRTAELEDLARYLQTVREDERSHLARELHDELGGLLTAAKLDVARVRKRLPDAGADVAERIDHLAATLDAGIALKRRIIEDLRPSSLDHLGLTQTLQIQCAEFARRTELAVEASIAETGLVGEAALAVYRLVQEALTNVSKYAQARQVRVTLAVADGHARLSVSDDGTGFDPAKTRLGAHGLAGMRFRVQSVGGRWQLDSAPGRGTTVRAEIPLPPAPDTAAPAA